MVDLNYNKVMESVTTSIQHWSRRILTVLGKITVVKSLLIPKFNHLILAIPNPSKDFMNILQKQIYNFIWKIKEIRLAEINFQMTLLIGGLRLFKVDVFFKALKCTWIRRIVNGTIDEKGMMLFSKLTGLNYDDLEKGANHTLNVARNVKNVFWKEVLVEWSNVKRKHIPSTIDDVLKSCIWDTENIKIGGKEISYQNWRKAGIYSVSDLVHIENNRFLLLHEIKAKYDLTLNFLEYNSLLCAIKSNYKHLFL